MDWSIPESQLAIKPPTDKSLGIGIVGCGEIVNIAHLPAYTRAGLNVTACFDLNREAASRTASKFGIPVVCSALAELLSRHDVHILDIAIHMEGRYETFASAAQAGKHILLQKPVSHSYFEAQQFVEIADAAGVKYQVNQQARWAGTHRAVKHWIQSGAIGIVTFIRCEVRGWQDDPKTWYVVTPDYTLIDHGIHYFDLIRFFAGGEAYRVCAMQSRAPDQVNVAPVAYGALIDFGDNLIAEHCFNNKVETPKPWSLAFTIDGTEGSIFCDFDSATLTRKDGTIQTLKPTPKWFPDAFLGPMADLMDAVAEEREPACSGRANLGTMRLVCGALESTERGRFVYLL